MSSMMTYIYCEIITINLVNIFHLRWILKKKNTVFFHVMRSLSICFLKPHLHLITSTKTLFPNKLHSQVPGALSIFLGRYITQHSTVPLCFNTVTASAKSIGQSTWREPSGGFSPWLVQILEFHDGLCCPLKEPN